MRKIGDKVVYSSYGVMEIVDIREEIVLDNSQKYYILEAPDTQPGSQTFIPVNNDKLVSKMRSLLTKDEVYEMVRSIDSIPTADWIADNRARSEWFKSIIEEGDRIKMISMIKLITKTAERRAEEGKKNYLADENAMHKAQKLLYSEIASVMGISEDEVPEFIKNNK